MKNILIIGLGRFGRHLAEKFIELGDEVMVVDKDEEAVQSVMDDVTFAQVGDCKKEDVIKSLGVENFDLCFVCIGGDFGGSLEITDLLKSNGAKRVIGKAGRDLHAKFLLKNGADEIVYPEKDMAYKAAVKYSFGSLIDYFEISKDISIYEILAPKSWQGKTIGSLNVRVKHGVNILAVRKESGELKSNIGADYKFEGTERIVVLGGNDDIKKIIH